MEMPCYHGFFVGEPRFDGDRTARRRNDGVARQIFCMVQAHPEIIQSLANCGTHTRRIGPDAPGKYNPVKAAKACRKTDQVTSHVVAIICDRLFGGLFWAVQG